ncbi:GIY-YIG nuclease family protein [Nocardiopsis synnemataformans]|uniref:GIY-YIG nuclease family protein n=1 Tax=Nocardiopsis synnemataformans TaxID=61305 RepID=UPI003EC10C4D
MSDLKDRETAVYRLYSQDDELLYVGLSCNPEGRWKQHESDRPWWSGVARKEVSWYPTRGDAEAAERAAIQQEKPAYNSSHAGEAAHLEDRNFPIGEDIATGQARRRIAELANLAATKKQITYITNRGRRIAAVVPLGIAEQAEQQQK